MQSHVSNGCKVNTMHNHVKLTRAFPSMYRYNQRTVNPDYDNGIGVRTELSIDNIMEPGTRLPKLLGFGKWTIRLS